MGKRLSAILISSLLLLWGVPAAQTVTNVRAIQKGNDIEGSYFLDKAAISGQYRICVMTWSGWARIHM